MLTPNSSNAAAFVSGLMLQSVACFILHVKSSVVSNNMEYAEASYTFKIKFANKQFTYNEILQLQFLTVIDIVKSLCSG